MPLKKLHVVDTGLFAEGNTSSTLHQPRWAGCWRGHSNWQFLARRFASAIEIGDFGVPCSLHRGLALDATARALDKEWERTPWVPRVRPGLLESEPNLSRGATWQSPYALDATATDGLGLCRALDKVGTSLVISIDRYRDDTAEKCLQHGVFPDPHVLVPCFDAANIALVGWSNDVALSNMEPGILDPTKSKLVQESVPWENCLGVCQDPGIPRRTHQFFEENDCFFLPNAPFLCWNNQHFWVILGLPSGYLT